jgi:dipeptidyl aminopeptidase/acylaminoacyl peptidase
MTALRLAVATLVAVAAAGSTGAGATPRIAQPLLTFGVDSWLGLCATDLQGHTFRLTDPRRSSSLASWSPDGSLLSYVEGDQLVFIDAEGHVRRSRAWQTGNSGFSSLEWSPDGRSFALVGYWGDYSWLTVTNVDGSGQRELSFGPGDVSRPSWSPDGRQILFSRAGSQWAATYVVDVNGGGVHEVLEFASDPVWSPDGHKIAYVTLGADGGPSRLSVANADGSEPHDLAQGQISWPGWSPDGSTLSFMRGFGETAAIALVDSDGAHERTLATGQGPAWAPDGSWIAFSRPGPVATRPQLAVIKPDGTAEHVVETGLPDGYVTDYFWRRPAELPARRRACVLEGTDGSDVIRGKSRAEVLYGAGGNDRIYADGGDDVVFGGTGRDEIHGASGADYLVGGPGHDLLFGGSGNDFIDAYDGVRDSLFGGPGSDRGRYDPYRDRRMSVEHYVHPR